MKFIKKVRKSILVFSGLLILVLIESLFFSQKNQIEISRAPSIANDQSAEFTFCTKVLNKKPINPIQNAVEQEHRVYFYARSQNLEKAQTEMRWFHNNRLIQTVGCSHPTRICFSSLSPRKLIDGLWSVDVIQGKELLFTATLDVSPLTTF